MADFPRFSDLFEIALREMVANNPDLSEDVIRQPGTEANSICAAIATVGEEIVRQVAVVYRDRILDTAEGDELDRLVWDWFGLKRLDAAKARATVTFVCLEGHNGGQLDAGTKLSTKTGVQFELVETLSFDPNESQKSAIVQAVLAGPEGNVAAGAIDTMLTQPFVNMTVHNDQAAAGGSSRESDDTFRARARSFWQAYQKGTLAAIEFGARTVAGVRHAKATEVTLTTPQGSPYAYQVSLTIADETGNCNDALLEAARAALDDWRACGVYVNLIAGQAFPVTIIATCAFRAGADTVAAQNRIRRALVDYVNSLTLGEILSPGALREIIRRDRDVASSPGPAILAPSGDYVPAANEVFRTEISRVFLNG